MAWFKRDRRDRYENSPKLEPVTEAEERWISDNLALLADAGVDHTDARRLGALYDAQLGEWEPGGENVGQDPNPTINLIGLGLGEHLVRRAGLRWVVATDETGSEIAIHGDPGDILVYPTNAVAKRWVTGVYGFLPEFANEIARRIAEVRAQSGP